MLLNKFFISFLKECKYLFEFSILGNGVLLKCMLIKNSPKMILKVISHSNPEFLCITGFQ